MVRVLVGDKEVEKEMYIVIDANSLEELNKLADELHLRGYKVWAEFREVFEQCLEKEVV